jgi:hypothetical protein
LKISKEEYRKFEQHYIMESLRNPDYRLGQAFINYFPTVDRELDDQQSIMLYYMTDNQDAQL